MGNQKSEIRQGLLKHDTFHRLCIVLTSHETETMNETISGLCAPLQQLISEQSNKGSGE